MEINQHYNVGAITEKAGECP